MIKMLYTEIITETIVWFNGFDSLQCETKIIV